MPPVPSLPRCERSPTAWRSWRVSCSPEHAALTARYPACPRRRRCAPGRTSSTGSDRDWTVYGHDLSNSRLNEGERTITAASVATLRKDWAIDGLVGVVGTPAVVRRRRVLRRLARNGARGVGRERRTALVDRDRRDVRRRARGHVRRGLRGRRQHPVKARPGDRCDRLEGRDRPESLRADQRVAGGRRRDRHPGHGRLREHREPGALHVPWIRRPRTTRETGNEQWKHYTSKNTADDGPGAGVWSTPAVDERRGLLYVGTGQSLAPKTGPLADSMLAIDVRTGALRWSRQFTYPDVFSAGIRKARTPMSARRRTSGPRTAVTSWARATRAARSTRSTATPATSCGRSSSRRAARSVARSARPRSSTARWSPRRTSATPTTNAPTDVTKVFGLDPATGRDPVDDAAPRQGVRAGERGAGCGVRRDRPRRDGRARHRTTGGGSGATRRRPRPRRGRRSSTAACCGVTASSCSARPGPAASSASRPRDETDQRCDAPPVPRCSSVLLGASCSSGSGTSTPARAAPSTTEPRSSGRPRSSGCAQLQARPAGTTEHTIRSDGVQRRYLLDVPEGYDGTKPYAILLGLHALTVSYRFVPSMTGFDQGGRYRFIGVAPSGRVDGTTPYWNAAPTADNYDVDFIAHLLDHLEATLCVNPSRVFSTGMSNGAQMSSLLACRLSDRIAAIAPVSGEEFLEPCEGEPVPILAFHGTEDPILPYAGGGLNATRIADTVLLEGQGAGRPPGADGCRRVDAAVGRAQRVRTELRRGAGCSGTSAAGPGATAGPRRSSTSWRVVGTPGRAGGRPSSSRRSGPVPPRSTRPT